MKKIMINIAVICAVALALVGYACCISAGNADADYILGHK